MQNKSSLFSMVYCIGNFIFNSNDMRKRNSILILFISLSLLLFSYSDASAQGKVPPFRIMQSNGKVFKAEDLPFEKPILIIYFSPECDHCLTFMKDLFKRADDF